MSNADFDIIIRGDAALDRFLADAPDGVARHAEDAQDAAAPVFAPNIAVHTPFRTGFLRNSESVTADGPWTTRFEATAEYASFVARYNPFADRGVEESEAEVEYIFEREFAEFVGEAGNA